MRSQKHAIKASNVTIICDHINMVAPPLPGADIIASRTRVVTGCI